jgi:glycosyltransferase involved in cell wall biosynthesis
MTTLRAIRVLHLGSPTGLYGAERWILALARHLPDDIESFIAVIEDQPGLQAPLCEYARRLGFRTHVFHSLGKLSLSAIKQIRQFVREHDIDVLHTHGYKTDLIGLIAVAGTGCRIIATPHGWSVDAGFKLQIYEQLDRIAFMFLDRIVPLSQQLFNELHHRPGLRTRLMLVPNGIDLSEVDAVAARAPELLLEKGRGAFLIGYIGQLIARKRLDTLIRAFARLQVPGKELWLIGDGAQRAELQELAHALGETERIQFFGYRDDRIALLQALDVFVMPSGLEGIPRCVLEAMAVGVPVIASDIPGCRELIEPDQSGLLFPVGDINELERQLNRLATDSDLRACLASRGQIMVRGKFSANAMAQAYACLYRQLAAHEHRPAVGHPGRREW